MTDAIISEWLADCADVTTPELCNFINNSENEIVRALYVLLEERSKYSQLVDNVCNQLFSFYRSGGIELQRFTVQFLPTLIYIYLNAAAHGDIKNCRTVETLLIGLYNLEVVDKVGQQKAVSFRLPSLAMLSIFHEPASLAPASLTESAIRRFEECNSKLVSWGPLRQVENLNAQNRLKVMTALLFIFNQQLGYISKFALEQLCKVATKLVTQGFTKPGHHQRSSYSSESSFVPRLLPRIPVSSQFLLEFSHAIYFAMYNDCWYISNQAIEDVHNRACYEGFADVLLVTNAIRNSASSGQLDRSMDGLMGISAALSPATQTPTVSKSMITNASFRTKKLPDDIPIQIIKEEPGADGKGNLVSITEEQDATDSIRTSSMRSLKDSKASSKISNFPVLGKKPRDKESKVARNTHHTSADKEKKLGSQTTLKDGTKGSSLTSSNDQIENDSSPNVNASKKLSNSSENNLVLTDQNMTILDSDDTNLENTGNLRIHNDPESLTSSIQVSSV